jgi:predicted transcriptional regulator
MPSPSSKYTALFYMRPEDKFILDRLAAHLKLSRSAVVREAIVLLFRKEMGEAEKK